MDWEQLARLGFTSDCLVEYSIITVATASPVPPLAQQSICYSLYQLQDQLDCGTQSCEFGMNRNSLIIFFSATRVITGIGA
ncbi:MULTISPECIES: hypothetical protein [unclassified Bacteroides]|uniref:hypothetical protein n=1 Tax=unclassified Bacteroides TaxID=2646097 RepID=UPI001F14DCBC|nr:MULTISPECIES: hypothetical protein [unclassified Bacteroides]